MNLKKNVFSYLIWFLYSVAVCISLLAVSGTITERAGYSEIHGYAAGSIWLLLAGVTVFLMHKLLAKPESAKKTNGMKMLVAESAVAVLLFALGVFLRINSLSEIGGNAAYFELAKVAEGNVVPQVVHGAVHIYLQLLHLVCLVFGNKIVACIWLQIVLQMIAGILLYLSVRKLAGTLPALTMLAFFTAGPLMVQEALSLSPWSLYFAIYALALLVCSLCVAGKGKSWMCLLAGIFIAIASYLDIIGITLFAFMAVCILRKNWSQSKPLSGRLLRIGMCLLGGGIGFIGLIAMDSFASGKAFTNVLWAWWQTYSPASATLPTMIDTAGTTVDVLFLLLLLTVGVFSFWCSSKRDRLTAWIAPGIVLVLLQIFSMTTEEMRGFSLLYILLGIVAGIDLQAILYKDIADVAEKEVDNNERNDNGIEYIKIKQQECEATLKQEPLDACQEKTQIKYIENPLPLPKKHVKKVLDYDIITVQEQDDYDIEVDDNDDFDI